MADSCRNLTYVRDSVGPATSTLMFVAGVVGNGLALGILGARRRSRPSAFAVLVTGLAVTDLLGTCFLSPAVFAAYARNSSLLGLARGKEPEKVERQLRDILPPEESSDFCHRIVLHGRAVCVARKPQCANCTLAPWCDHFHSAK